ncbi:protein kinase [bacterium]|nr:protein kinase [bacterium]
MPDSTPIPETQDYDTAAHEQAVRLSAAQDVPPSTVPGYEVLKRIGAGKFGSVWLAREHNTGKQVAIKFYSQRRGVDWALLGREVEKLAVLYTSRNIVGLISVGWEHDPPYYVMEYLENGSLAQRLDAGPVSIAEAVRMTTRIAQALVHAHGSGILHCDIKPANILLDQDDEPRLCDFGQSRLADERSHSLGTLFYMAPEQADLHAVPDARWDVYALGALLFHLLVGHPPHRSDIQEQRLREARSLAERLEIYRHIIKTAPRPQQHRQISGVDTALAELVDRCLAVDPARRLPNPQAVVDRLQQRERQRARRPLILAGIVLPVLLVLSIMPFALDALRDTVTTSRANLISRAQESDALSAKLLAGSLQRELDDRLNELLAIAEDDTVRQLVQSQASQPRSERQELFALLDRRKHQVELRRAELQRSLDASWFLQDAEGYQRWRSPLSETIDEAFPCRDYFHGQGGRIPASDDDATDDCMNLAPITSPHVSTPYSSRTSQQWKIALSVPVWPPGEDEVSTAPVQGVLARSLNLSSLLADYQKGLATDHDDRAPRYLALVDARSGILLAHPWLTADHLEPLTDLEEDLRVEASLSARLADWVTNANPTMNDEAALRLDHYHDPVSRLAPEEYGGDWIAAMALIGDTGWVAIVQERRGPVVAPVETLRDRLVTSGVIGMLVMTGLIGCMWWLIMSLMSDRRPQWLKSWQRRWQDSSSTPATTPGRISESA